MNLYDYITQHEGALKKIGGKYVHLLKYATIYREYARMEREGAKKMYIVAILAERTGLSERTIERIAKRMKEII